MMQALIDPSWPDDQGLAEYCGFTRVPSALGLIGNGVARGMSPPARTPSMDRAPSTPPLPPAPAPAGLLFPGRLNIRAGTGMDNINGGQTRAGEQLRRLQSDPGAARGIGDSSDGDSEERAPGGTTNGVRENGESHHHFRPAAGLHTFAMAGYPATGAANGATKSEESLAVEERFAYFRTKVARLQVHRVIYSHVHFVSIGVM